MATNPPKGDGHRNGAVKQRSQTYNPKTETWTKRDANTGRFMDGKKDGTPFPTSSRTKQTIAEYLGCDNWEELKENFDEEYERILRKGGRNCISTIQSANPTDLMLKNLRNGDIIEVNYFPDRKLLLEFIRKDTYKVVSSTNSRIEQGDTIYTSSLYNDLPLICEIKRNGISKGTYRSAHGHNIQSIKRIKQKERI